MGATLDQLLNDFAFRCFRDTADEDYIVARMAYRAELVGQCLWATQQALEKYLKCILLLNRVSSRDMGHKLANGLEAIRKSGNSTLELTVKTSGFIEKLDAFGGDRYLAVSNYAFGSDLVQLDRAVWEVRRFCTLEPEPRQTVLRTGNPAPKVNLAGGHLEQIIDTPKHPARGPLLWQNCFFGKRVRRNAKLKGWFKASNSPLYLNPEILDEVMKYVRLPSFMEKAQTHQNKF